MPLRLFNSLTERLEPFNPYREGEATLYVCGPTVYSDSHLGHAKTYVSFDVILRYLRFAGFHTFYVQNITDVGHLTGDTDEGEDSDDSSQQPSNSPTPPPDGDWHFLVVT